MNHTSDVIISLAAVVKTVKDDVLGNCLPKSLTCY